MNNFKLNSADTNMIRFIVNRHHVYDSNRTICRSFYDRFKKVNTTIDIRKVYYRYAIKLHNKNKRFFYTLMRGNI